MFKFWKAYPQGTENYLLQAMEVHVKEAACPMALRYESFEDEGVKEIPCTPRAF
jgi:hypothetical protein